MFSAVGRTVDKAEGGIDGGTDEVLEGTTTDGGTDSDLGGTEDCDLGGTEDCDLVLDLGLDLDLDLVFNTGERNFLVLDNGVIKFVRLVSFLFAMDVLKALAFKTDAYVFLDLVANENTWDTSSTSPGAIVASFEF